MIYFVSSLKHTPKFSSQAAVAALIVVISVNLFAQGKAVAPANSAADTKYEAALDAFYALNYEQEKDINSVISYYRQQTGKLDSKYNYMRRPEFVSEAAKRFEANWKARARNHLSLTDLQYLIMFQKSALRNKLIQLEAPMFHKENLVPLIDSIPVQQAAKPMAVPAAPQPPFKR